MGWDTWTLDLAGLNVELMTDAQIRDTFSDEHEDLGGPELRLVLWGHGQVVVICGSLDRLQSLAVAVGATLG